MKFVIIIAILLFFSKNVRAEKFDTQMFPTQAEKLVQPIKLTRSCKGIDIIEWRATRAMPESTGINPKSIELIDRVCNKVFKKINPFLVSQGRKPIKLTNIKQTLSLMPFDPLYEGIEYRNLNDIQYRFFNRRKTYDQNGAVEPIVGYHQRVKKHIYLRNDVLDDINLEVNSKFTETLVHELFHAITFEFGVFTAAEIELEEKLASNFENYL